MPKREIILTNTVTQAGDIPNDPIRVYDTSGPNTLILMSQRGESALEQHGLRKEKIQKAMKGGR